jgi:toxin YoeB
MEIKWTPAAMEDYHYWQKRNPKKVERINELIKDCKHNPFKGIGKPEPLKGNLSGYWSRRIDNEHRLVYSISKGTLTVIQCRFHY